MVTASGIHNLPQFTFEYVLLIQPLFMDTLFLYFPFYCTNQEDLIQSVSICYYIHNNNQWDSFFVIIISVFFAIALIS